MSGVSVVKALDSDRDRSIAALVTAFTSDPVIRWMLPDPQQYLRYFPDILRYFAGGAFDHKSAYRTEDYLGTALWLPPGAGPDEESLVKVMEEGVDPALQGDAFTMLEKVSSSHPDVAHWYLPVIGVDPMYQGKGYGSALLARGLEICDQNRLAAYLEATNPRSIPLYQRFGYEIQGKIQAGSSPAITTMFRPAR
jgi:GNAT superfamily N-acetyltransferase